MRTTEDLRYYHQVSDDVVTLARGQGGYITGWGGKQVPLIDSFFGGPTMVRGFAPNGFGPRDLTPGTTMDANIVRSSVGAGLTWASPFGALTVNYAVPLTKASYDVVQPLGFSASPF